MGDEDDVNVFLGTDTHRKIQFWSDASGKEFAVRLSSDRDFRAVSNPAAKYTRLVEEAEYFSDMKYDWKFLLGYWMGVRNGRIEPFDLNGKEESDSAASDLTSGMQTAAVKAGNEGVRRKKKSRPVLKCRYCMLSYNSEKERSEHESLWHAEKRMKGT
ncbi:hypothetical protein [Nitrososphaera sp.]|uniref:hypothetical protein n=1 Tax=Nitrososphaera sp. TaxID=1971748 RepID=UPI00307FA0CD